MASLTRSDLAAPRRSHVEKVYLGAHGFDQDDYVWVRRISALDVAQLRASQGARPELGNLAFLYDLLSRALCDEDGRPLFASADDALSGFGLSFPALEHVAQEVLRIGGVVTEEKN